MNPDSEVRRILIDVLNLDVSPAELTGDTRLLGGGLMLNSLVGMQVIFELETRFGIRIHVVELTRDVFTDISHLVSFVRDKVGAGSPER